MIEAQPYSDEVLRLASLRQTRLLDSPIEERFERITRMVCRILEVPIALFNLIDEDRQHYKSAQGLQNTDAPLKAAFCTHAIAADDMLLVPNASVDNRFHDNPFVTGAPNVGFYAGCPIHTNDGMPIGTLCAIDTKPRDMTPEQLESFRDLAAMIETELKLSSLSRVQANLMEELTQANRLALVDPLTRLWNRGGIEKLVEKEWAEAVRHAKPVTFVMADIDHFKKVNDTYGHAAGDIVLKTVAKKLLEALRAEDAIGRIGGEEFLIMLTDCHPNAVFSAAERIRSLIAAEPIMIGEIACNITISLGTATAIPTANLQIEEVVKSADGALYLAKNNGRNRIESATGLKPINMRSSTALESLQNSR